MNPYLEFFRFLLLVILQYSLSCLFSFSLKGHDFISHCDFLPVLPVLVRPALYDLQLIPVGRDKVQVQWHCREEGLRGYWLSWQKSDTQSSSPLASSTLYLPPGSFSASLTYLAPSTRVCVSPVYNSGRGDGLCCTIHTHTGCSTNNN